MGETMGKVPWLSDDENVAFLETALITTMADDGYQESLIRLSALSSGPTQDTLVFTMHARRLPASHTT